MSLSESAYFSTKSEGTGEGKGKDAKDFIGGAAAGTSAASKDVHDVHGGSGMASGKKKALKVLMSIDAYQVCLEHVTTHQNEEMIGLLIGELDEAENTISFVAPKVIKRKDKRPDRVELSPEGLSSGMRAAEHLAAVMDKPGMRILGWYHSHPKITVWPSHVDLNTQERYQHLDKDFVGFIFSTYGGDACDIEAICFQSVRDATGKVERLTLPFEIVCGDPKAYTFNVQERASVAEILYKEEEEALVEAMERLHQLRHHDADDVTENRSNVDVRSDTGEYHVHAKLISTSNINTSTIIDSVMVPLFQQLKFEKETMDVLNELNAAAAAANRGPPPGFELNPRQSLDNVRVGAQPAAVDSPELF